MTQDERDSVRQISAELAAELVESLGQEKKRSSGNTCADPVSQVDRNVGADNGR
jgi:hypothetical protein